MSDSLSIANRTGRRAYIEDLLRAYPKVGNEETTALIHWFRQEASAHDIGLIASDPSLAPGYRQLKADHLDRRSGADLVWAFVAFSVIAAILMSLIWLSL